MTWIVIINFVYFTSEHQTLIINTNLGDRQICSATDEMINSFTPVEGWVIVQLLKTESFRKQKYIYSQAKNFFNKGLALEKSSLLTLPAFCQLLVDLISI